MTKLGCPLRLEGKNVYPCLQSKCAIWDTNSTNDGQCGLLTDAKATTVSALALVRIADSIEVIEDAYAEEGK